MPVGPKEQGISLLLHFGEQVLLKGSECGPLPLASAGVRVQALRHGPVAGAPRELDVGTRVPNGARLFTGHEERGARNADACPVLGPHQAPAVLMPPPPLPRPLEVSALKHSPPSGLLEALSSKEGTLAVSNPLTIMVTRDLQATGADARHELQR
jgi:hypothetical protein